MTAPLRNAVDAAVAVALALNWLLRPLADGTDHLLAASVVYASLVGVDAATAARGPALLVLRLLVIAVAVLPAMLGHVLPAPFFAVAGACAYLAAGLRLATHFRDRRRTP